MNTEAGKTIMYVAVAAVMAAVGVSLAPSGPRAAQDGIEALIGTEFYKNFTNPSEATSIEVISYDPATATATPFSVEFKDGLWRIPTRFNYPADAKDRLAKVAASIIGLKREALAGRTESEQAEFQVLDPKGEKSENLKGIGNRVTLRNGNTVLADYIVGKQDPKRPGFYYVRKPDEKPTFIAKVELNLSTKFTDWIESDVLNLEGNRLTQIDVQKHTLEITRAGGAQIVGRERNLLTRKSSSDPWKLEGLDEAAEEVNQDETRKLVTALDDLKIVGVRPKPESLRKDLRSEEGLKLNQEVVEDLADRGFFVLRSPRGGAEMVSKEGDLVAGTDQGVELEMHFGTVFEGTEEEIELGFAKQPAEQKDDAPADAEQTDDAKPEDKPADDKGGAKKKSRFIFVTARVNPELFGVLEEPVKPEPPSEQPAPEKSDEKPEEKPEAKPEEITEEKTDEAKPAEESKEADKSPQPDPKQVYEDALKKYEADKSKYEADLKSRAEKVKEAEEKVKTLNARFADWYYVISSESFDNLRQGRSTLVKSKADAEKKPEDEPATDSEPGDETESDAAAPKSEEKPEPAKPEPTKPEKK